MRRRRRRPRVVWLPNTGTEINATLQAAEQSSAIIITNVLSFTPSSPTVVFETPMVLDQDPDAKEQLGGINLATRQFTALEEQTTAGYRLRRIVGSMYTGVTADQAGAGSSPAAVLVQAGFIVRRTDAGTGISLASAAPSAVKETDVGSLENNEDPWIWRKDWLLTPINNVLTAGTSVLLPVPDPGDPFSFWANALPRTNHAITGPNGNPTVDVKTARKIANEERLFFDISITDLAPIPQGGHSLQFMCVFPYRALASVFQMGGNRKNASR